MIAPLLVLLLLQNLTSPHAFSLGVTKASVNEAALNSLRSSSDELFGGDTVPENGVEILNLTTNELAARILTTKTARITETSAIPTILIDTSLPGWGSGVHPTTFLCLSYLVSLASTSSVKKLTDYGCGSGVLGITAKHLQLGPDLKVIGVDIESEALSATRTNWDEHNFPSSPDSLELFHAREVIPGYPISDQDLLLANILIGALCRPSMVAVLVSALKVPDLNGENGGLICFSGIRPDEKDSLEEAYGKYIEFDDSQYVALSASKTPGSLQNYGFDVGDWCRVVGRRKVGKDFSADMSEAAIQ
ncbi:hypothetical protein TrLO_g11605 [Triparma laevis f. longispina]|uniref:Methyltransferase small domain-containing protein n=1 Tax=Triparma laevis f. longispina TaxID=1714387 RepID=A0A9W7F980_9STRA|nr:hypothetical protein TrLO_g11605 [Triparma laevis f. longispina]